MKRKVVALLLAMTMCTSILAGCSSGGGEDKKPKEKGPAGDTIDENGKVNGIMYKEGLPLVDKGDYSFSIFADGTSETGEFYMLKEFEKQTNVKVELNLLPNEVAKERMNLDLNSGDYADVIGGWTLNDSSILTYGSQQGVFIPLEDYFEKYAPNITAALENEGAREEMTAPDGHIYAIPYVVDAPTVAYSPWINSRWLENVGMSMPTTTDEFEKVLKAFKKQDANGNGDPNDEIPFSADPNNKHIEAMAGYFGMPMDKYGYSIQDGEIVYAGASKTYREFLTWFAGLYEQGLIDIELYTQDLATWKGKGNKDMYGVGIAYGSNEFSGIIETTEKSEFDALPVLNTEEDGIWLRDSNGHGTLRTQAVITDKAKNPEVIVRWFDNVFALENSIGCVRGPVDVVTFKEGDRYRAIDTLTLPADLQEEVTWANVWPQSLPKYLPPGFEFLEDRPLYPEKKAMEKFYEPDLTEELIPKNWVELEDIDRYTDLDNAMREYFIQQQALFVTGKQDASNDKHWKKYVDGLYSLGLEDYVKMNGYETIAK